MTDVAALIADMVRSGVDPDLIGRTAEALSERAAVLVPDEAAERRRMKDRERKALRKSAEVGGNHASVPFPKESPQTPKETPLSQPTTPKEKTPKGVQKKAVRLPADWQLPPEWRQDAIDQGLPPQRIDLEAAKMRDWSRSSPNGAKLDWRASWRNWCRGAAEKIGPQGRAPPTRDPSIQELLRDRRQEFADHVEPTPNGPRLIAAR